MLRARMGPRRPYAAMEIMYLTGMKGSQRCHR